MKTENLSTLKIHKLTQEQYDRELAAGNIDETALYLTPDEETSYTYYPLGSEYSEKVVYRKFGSSVMVNLYYPDSPFELSIYGTPNSWNTLFTLSEECRPSETIAFILLDNTGNGFRDVHYYARITTEGNVDIFLYEECNVVPYGSVTFIQW